MFDVLVRAGCFIAIIVAGYLLRKFGFFKEGDFNVLSKIVLKITLPAAFIYNFAGKEIVYSGAYRDRENTGSHVSGCESNGRGAER